MQYWGTDGIHHRLAAGKQDTGRLIRAAAIVTGSGLLFVAGTDDNRLRAFDATTGREVWVGTLDGFGNANPITYLGGDGKQYVAVTASDTVVAFALP